MFYKEQYPARNFPMNPHDIDEDSIIVKKVWFSIYTIKWNNFDFLQSWEFSFAFTYQSYLGFQCICLYILA